VRSWNSAVEFFQIGFFLLEFPAKREYRNNIIGELSAALRIPKSFHAGEDKQRDEYWVKEFFLNLIGAELTDFTERTHPISTKGPT
jgi:hypothetical protein